MPGSTNFATRTLTARCRTRERLATAVVLLGLLAHGCARFTHRPPERAQLSGKPSPHQIATDRRIPAEFLDLVTTKKAFANLATVMPNGSPQVTPVWFPRMEPGHERPEPAHELEA